MDLLTLSMSRMGIAAFLHIFTLGDVMHLCGNCCYFSLSRSSGCTNKATHPNPCKHKTHKSTHELSRTSKGSLQSKGSHIKQCYTQSDLLDRLLLCWNVLDVIFVLSFTRRCALFWWCVCFHVSGGSTLQTICLHPVRGSDEHISTAQSTRPSARVNYTWTTRMVIHTKAFLCWWRNMSLSSVHVLPLHDSYNLVGVDTFPLQHILKMHGALHTMDDEWKLCQNQPNQMSYTQFGNSEQIHHMHGDHMPPHSWLHKLEVVFNCFISKHAQ